MPQTDRAFGEASTEYALGRYGHDIFGDFEINAECMKSDLPAVLEDLVTRCPVARSNAGPGFPVFSRQRDIRRICQDWETFSSASGAFELVNDRQGPFLVPDESDPPKHTAWRQALNPYFGPRAIARYEAGIRADANQLIDAFIDRGRCDFVAEFGSKLPGWAFFKNILGVPLADLDWLIDGVHKGSFDVPERRAEHFGRVYAYLDDYLRKRLEEPKRGDVVDLLVEGVPYGDGQQSPWEDRVSVLLTLTFGGISTSTQVMSAGLHYLATHPEDRRKLLQRPELIPRAVEEFVRLFPAVVAMGRRCTRDVEIGGTPLKPGDWTMLLYAAGSRDPDAIDRPGEVDFERKTLVHTAFGAGPHRCLGSHFARLDIRCAIEEWLKRIPEFNIAPDFTPEYQTGMIRSMQRLELTL
jgi:cytochrome P450